MVDATNKISKEDESRIKDYLVKHVKHRWHFTTMSYKDIHITSIDQADCVIVSIK
jgi:hypothetical protein